MDEKERLPRTISIQFSRIMVLGIFKRTQAYRSMINDVLLPFLVLLENVVCSYKRIMSRLENSYVFLLHPSLLENLMCSRNIF